MVPFLHHHRILNGWAILKHVPYSKFFTEIFSSFETTFWKKPGPIEREALLDLVEDKDALFCLLTDKIDLELVEKAPNLKVVGKGTNGEQPGKTIVHFLTPYGASSISPPYNFKASYLVLLPCPSHGNVDL